MRIFRSITDFIKKSRRKNALLVPEAVEVDENREQAIRMARKSKIEKVRGHLKEGVPYLTKKNGVLDFLSNELREKYSIIDTENVSNHDYDQYALDIISRHESGLVLDCGCGKRSKYYDNIINFEIVDYDTTDVIGVGEELPFEEETFDAVLSLNVLEHVKDPFKAASEICRVLKEGGELYCVVPHLQPVHGFPNHYYNMTAEGLRNLFHDDLEIESQKVISSGLPIYTLTWILNSWLNDLKEPTRSKFLNLTVQDLLHPPENYKDQNFVTQLSELKNFELASTTALWASKKTPRITR